MTVSVPDDATMVGSSLEVQRLRVQQPRSVLTADLTGSLSGPFFNF